MHELTKVPIKSRNPVMLHSKSEQGSETPHFIGIAYGLGRIAVGGTAEDALLTRTQTAYASLAAVGMSNTKIGDLYGISFRKVAAQLDTVFEKVKVNRRPQLSRALFETGVWRVSRPGPPLDLTGPQIPIVERVSEGLSDAEIANDLHYTSSNIHAHIVRIGHRSGWIGRQPIALAAMLSGEIGDVVNQNNMTQSVDAQLNRF